jgi:hypothetical protein
MERGIRDPQDEIVVRLAGEAYDFIHHNIEHPEESDDNRAAWKSNAPGQLATPSDRAIKEHAKFITTY